MDTPAALHSYAQQSAHPRATDPPPSRRNSGYCTCAQAAVSTKAQKIGSSVAYNTRRTVLSQKMGREDASGLTDAKRWYCSGTQDAAAKPYPLDLPNDLVRSSVRQHGKRGLALPLCDVPLGCCFFIGPWTVTRSSLRVLRRVAAFCRPLRPVLLLVLFPRSRSPVVGVLGLCWMWQDVLFARQRRPVVGALRLCWLPPPPPQAPP